MANMRGDGALAVVAPPATDTPEIDAELASEPAALLTERQTEILSAATRGLTNDDIARQLGITSSCVKQHLSAVFQKLGVATRAEAVAIALRKQLLKI